MTSVTLSFGIIFMVFLMGVFLPMFVISSSFLLFFNVGAILTFFFPAFIGLVFRRLLFVLDVECQIAEKVGPENILWYDVNHRHFGRSTYAKVAQLGWTMSDPFLGELFKALDIERLIPDEIGKKSYATAASVSYYKFIKMLRDVMAHDFSHIMVVWFVTKHSIKIFKSIIDRIIWAVCSLILYYMILLSIPAPLFSRFLVFILGAFSNLYDTNFWNWFKWRFTYAILQIVLIAVTSSFIGLKYSSNTIPGGPNSYKFSVLFRDLTMRFATQISAMGLPTYIRGSVQPKYSLEETLDIMKELGWPINVSIDEPDIDVVPTQYREWLLCGTDFKQGIHNLKCWVDRDLDFLRLKHLEWKRTEQYGNVHNEFRATARYFKSPRYSFPDLSIDDVWWVIGDIFKHSQLTPFNYIIRKWEKRYALGAFMRRGKSKMKRSTFINSIGYQNFKILWRKTFEWSSLLTVASASRIKDEALPYAKWVQDKVRTVIGAPLPHYIMSTIFNFEPNHRFRYNETPIKIGMPLNGYNMSKLYMSHSRCQHHVAGDMTEFDSTVSGKIKTLIMAVRKKGFEHHKDAFRIAHLIDVNYHQVENQLINTTSTGNVYKKGTGLATGHSSTSMDNSLALLILYLMAWKELTGLSGKDFLYYNQLSNFGDDHILSYLSTKPPAWNFKNIQKTMSKWGVTNRKEAEGPIDKIPFLSKYCRKPTYAEKNRFTAMGMEVPLFIVYHDKERLLGKMLAPVRTLNPLYRAKRLLSYMDLCAHHYDVYRGIRQTLSRSIHMKMSMDGAGLKIPTYESILKRWYNPNESFKNFGLDSLDLDIPNSDTKVFTYGDVSLIDSILGVFAIVPDLINPVIFNHGYVRAFQGQLSRYLQWPFQLLAAQNQIVHSRELDHLIKRTNYSVLDSSTYRGAPASVSMSSLLVRHWLYNYYKTNFSHPGFGRIMNSLSNKIASIQYALNASVSLHVDSFSFRFLDIFVIMALNWVVFPPIFEFIPLIRLPRPDIIVGLLSHYLQVLVWSSLPPNFNDINRDILKLKETSLLIEAPTGTGKSTVLVSHLSRMAIQFSKIIVVEPRVSLATSLSAYVASEFGVDTGYWTHGTRSNPNCRVEYVTPQEALLNFGTLANSNGLWVFDEVHLLEPMYITLLELVFKRKMPIMGMTGTPSQENIDRFAIHKPLTIASLWSLTIKRHISATTDLITLRKEYEDYVVNIVNSSHPFSRILVFYPWTKKTNFENRLNKHTSKCYSGNLDVTGQVILSTSVADVGITIPDVDIVITPDFDFTSLYIDEEIKVELVRIDKITIRQRCGRTGRTNNGIAFTFISPNLDFKHKITPAIAKMTGFLESLQIGIAPTLVKELYPNELTLFMNNLDLGNLPIDAPETFLDELNSKMNEVRNLRQIREHLEDYDHDFIDSWVHLEAGGAGTFEASSQVPTHTLIQQAFTAAKIAVKASFGEGFSEEEVEEMKKKFNDHLNLIKNATRFNQFQGMFNEITIMVT